VASSQATRSPVERAQEAESLLGHAIFGEAVLELRRSIFERLLAQPIGSDEVVTLHMKAKLLDELVGELRSVVNAIRVRQPQKERREWPSA
jgi:hypothetical protein